MYRPQLLLRSMLSMGTLRRVSKELNEMLDIRQRDRPVPFDELKQYLRVHVVPVLHSTTLDRRHDGGEMRRLLGQLVRDAAFSAKILRAKPSGPFLQHLQDFIISDNLSFVPNMSSTQASKTIEYLSKLMVRDAAVYAVLLAQVDFLCLRDVGRAMFAMSEAGLGDLLLTTYIPLYCGESWKLEAEPNEISSSSNDVFEAVRVLRALSKCVRTGVENRRAASSRLSSSQRRSSVVEPAGIPHASIQRFRTNLLAFVLENRQIMRGAHWVNFIRAMLHFPVEYQRVEGLEASQVWRDCCEACPDVSFASDPIRHVSCEDVVQVSFLLFMRGVRERRASTAAGPSPASPSDYDLTFTDMVKYLTLLQQLASMPLPTALRQEEVDRVMSVLSRQASQLSFVELVQVMHALRFLPYSANQATSPAMFSEEAGKRLLAAGIPRIPLRDVVLFASALVALRVRECRSFEQFLLERSSTLPASLTPDSVVVFINCVLQLSTANDANEKCINDILSRLAEWWRRRNNNRSADGDCPSLMAGYPLQVSKILRALALLEYSPNANIFHCFFGSNGEIVGTPATRDAGPSILFDVSRSLALLFKAAKRLPDDQRDATTMTLWERGMRCTLIPLLLDECRSFAERQHQLRQGRGPLLIQSGSYLPLAWRSSVEAISVFVIGANRDVTHLCDAIARPRMTAVAPACHDLIRAATAVTSAELDALAALPEGPHKRFAELNYNGNAPVHFLSLLLMWERLVFQFSDPVTAISAESVEASYLSLLRSSALDGTPSPMSVVERIFAMPLRASSGAEGDEAPSAPLLNKKHALEITTNLPFAISLVLRPGPVNEIFTENCVPLMLQLE